MKLLRVAGILMLLPAHTAWGATLEREFRYAAERLETRWRGDTVEVAFRGGAREPAPGHPDLPVVSERLDLPPGTKVRNVEVVDLETRPVAGRAQVLPALRLRPGLGPFQRSLADPVAYARPQPVVALGYQGSLRGRNLAWLLVRPVRWDPTSGRLERLERLRVRVELEPRRDTDAVARERIVREWEENAPPASDPRVTSATPMGSTAQPFKAAQLPSVLGSPVAYVIITTDALATEFQRLADWKTQTGVPAVVRTLSFIHQQYPEGVDDADRIRRFIRDAYSRWGTAWVLLGGDTDQIPTRLAYSTFCYQSNCSPPPLNDIASDLYYSCLDGNWNADGDAYYGESGDGSTFDPDKADLLPEVWVGRAPVSTVGDATRFVDRTLQYARTPLGDYEHRVLFFAEVLFPQNWTPGESTILDGAELAEACLPSLRSHPALRYARLYENYLDPRWEPGALQEKHARVVDSLSAGYNVAVHVGHGYRNVASCGDSNFTNADATALTNGLRYANTYMANCTSNAIDFPCLGEALMQAPNGGSVTNIGSSRVDFPIVGQDFQQEYFRLVFEDSVNAVGEAQGRQKLPFVAYAAGVNAYRWTVQALLLLGDPELRIWTGPPRTLTVSHPASLAANVTSMAVTVMVAGQPLRGALVTLYKPNDEYRIATTDAAGQAVLDFRPDDVGSVTLTVTGYDCRPYQAVVPVTAALAPVLGDLAPLVDDDGVGGTVGNGNQQVDAGEVVDLRVPVRNSGGTTATSVSGTLATTDPLVTVLAGVNAYGNVAPDAVANGSGWFRFSTPYTAPDQREIPFALTLTDAAAHTWVETIPITLRAPEPRHYSHTVIEIAGNGNGHPEPGETVDYAVQLRNLGTGTANGVTAVLRNYDGLATVTDSTAAFGGIAPGSQVPGDPFRISVGAPGARFELRVSAAYGLLYTQRLDLTWPAIPTGLTATGSSGSIALTWQAGAEADLLGYVVHRATSAGGPFIQANAVPGDRTAYYLDSGLAPLTRYYYEVAAVDSSGNVSALTPAVSGSTNPPYHAQFPIEMGKSGGNTPSSVAVARIYRPGTMDILAGADVLYAWHADGTAPVDADQSSVTSGDFTTLGNYYAAGPSVGDLDGGGLEIVAPAWNSKSVYAFDVQGKVKPGWPVVTPYEIFSCAAIWDLNGDGSKEVVFGSNGPALYAVRANGSEWLDGDSNPATLGVFKTLGASFNFGTPALADLDGNGETDIVYGGFDGVLYAWRPNGASLPGFPIALGGNIASSVALGYLDGPGDTQLDIVVSSGGDDDSLYVFGASGARRAGFPVGLRTSGGYGKQPSLALADLNGDGYLDIVAAGTDGRLYAYDRDGVLLPGFAVRFSVLTEAATESSPVIADINGDGSPDIVIGDDDAMLSAFGADGQPLAGFPIRIGGEVRGTPALCDCDGDGLSEIVAAGWDSRLYVWDYDFPFSPGKLPPWPQFHHDAMRTGFASSETALAAPAPEPPTAVRLGRPAPNPARLRVRTQYEIPPAHVGDALEVEVFDLMGRRVRRLEEKRATVGRFVADWDLRGADGRPVGAGLYVVRLRVGEAHQSQRVVVLP